MRLRRLNLVKATATKLHTRKGEDLVVLDYAQLELRVMALYSEDPAMCKVLCDPKGDMHQMTSDNLHIDRDPSAKNANFLLIFAGQAYVFSELLTSLGMPTTQNQAQAIISGWNKLYWRVPERRNEWLNEHREHGFIRLWTNRKRQLLDVDWDDHRSVHKAETTLSNNGVQGSGQDFLKAALIRADPAEINPDYEVRQRMQLPRKHDLLMRDYARRVDRIRRVLLLAKTKWLLQVHDEAIWRCDAKASDEVARFCAELMCMRHFFPAIGKYCVPLVADGGIAKNWKDAKAKDNPRKIHFGFENWEPE